MNTLTIIDKYRMEAGLTRRQLADIAMVSIKRINSSAKLTVADVGRIINVLGVSSSEFWSNYKRPIDIERERYAIVFSKLVSLGFNTQQKLEQVIDKLKIDESYEMLLSKITSNPVGTTEILKISVKDQNPEQAALIANTITDVFIKEVIRILKVNNVEVIDKAIAIHNPINSKQEVYLAISAILGIMTGTLIAFILESLDNTLKSQEDVEKYLGLPVIGATLDITKILEKNATGSNLKNLIVHNLPKSPVSESYRSIRTNIQFANVDRGIKTIMFTSSTEKEGKTTTISNVAMTFADAGYKVVIVDCDLRKSEIHRFFGISNAIGITDELLSGDDYKKYIHKDDDTKLHIIPAGKMPANPSEILCSDVMKALVMKLKRDYDYIFIDAPPILPVTDATVMSSFIDAVV